MTTMREIIEASGGSGIDVKSVGFAKKQAADILKNLLASAKIGDRVAVVSGSGAIVKSMSSLMSAVGRDDLSKKMEQFGNEILREAGKM